MSAAERCPCCGELVNGNSYELIFSRPPLVAFRHVCRACETVLRGDDLAAHDALVMAAARRIEGGADARTFH